MSEAELELLDDTTCRICFAEFLDPEDFAIHFQQVHARGEEVAKRKCYFCDESFSDLEKYAYHIRDDHLFSLKCCKYCNRIFSEEDSHRRHESKHYTYVNKSHYACSNCKSIFTNRLELEDHESTFHSDSKEGAFLKECLPILSSVINIKALSFINSYNEDVIYICVKCEYTTPNIKVYIDHLKETNCRSLACEACSSVYQLKTGLIGHFNRSLDCSHDSEKKMTSCPECRKPIKTKLIKEHSKYCKAIKCHQCDILFNTMYDLSQHQTDVHPSAMFVTPCSYCKKVFAGPDSLKKHIRRAHDQLHLYKYHCIYCKSYFKHPKYLFAHFFSTHKDLEPYTCRICNKKFRVRKRFTFHIKLDHKSIGYVEFDEQYHVFFSDKKSEKPFNPLTTTENVQEDKNSEVTNDILNSGPTETTVGTNIEKVCENDEGKLDKKDKRVHFDATEKCDNEVTLVNVNSDFMSATETEFENEKLPENKKRKKTTNRKRIRKQVEKDSSDDEPLIEIKRKQKEFVKNRIRTATWNRRKKKDINDKKKRFVCNICKKYCYTFQNYNNHISMHYKSKSKTKCIKCEKIYDSGAALAEHIAKEHSSSQLTETLRKLLERRKTTSVVELTTSEKFLRTIKKVPIPESDATVTVKPIGSSLSVQKFIESFTPESEAPKKKDIIINSHVTMKPVEGVVKEPTIKLTQCNLQHVNMECSKLAMPIKFKQDDSPEFKSTIKLVLTEDKDVDAPSKEIYAEDVMETDNNFYDNTDTVIPEVAQEVMLEGSEENTKTLYIPHKVVLPKLPEDCSQIRIAHLQEEAPYYRIVKVEEVLKGQAEPSTKTEPTPKVDIKLPDGTKLVSVNPLAHLLGDRPIEKIVKPKSKKANSKSIDFETTIAKALLKLKKTEKVNRGHKEK